MTNEPLERLLSTLGYSEKFGVKCSPFESFSSLEFLSPLSRIISRINENNQHANIHGTYVIKPESNNESPNFDFEIQEGSNNFQPVVFVAEAETLEQAREIHRSLWNSSSAPFIIIRLPDQIRIYMGLIMTAIIKNTSLSGNIFRTK